MTQLFALLLAGYAAAAEVPHLKCPDGREPLFIGQPFRAIYCPPDGKEPSVKAAEPAEGSLPRKGGWSGALKGLDGRWRGIMNFAGTRYEVTVEISKSGTQWKLWPKDYATYITFPMEAEIKKPGWFSGGQPKLSLWNPAKPDEKRGARFWLGANPIAGGPTRTAVWRMDGRPELHRVDYDASSDHLAGFYTMADPARGAVGATFDLSRIGAD